MSRLLLFAFCCLLLSTARAQTCGTERLHEYRMQTDPGYAARVQQAGAERIATMGSWQRSTVQDRDTVFELPVVFHVMHNGQSLGTFANPSDAQLLALLDFTNKAFNAEWYAFPDTLHGGVRTNIRFVLAAVDPTCTPQQGIVRVNASSVPGYATGGLRYPGGNTTSGANPQAIRALSSWRPGEYINIYVVDGITDGVLGFATYASSSPVDACSLFISCAVAMAPDPSLAHELGHVLDLRHVFEGDNGGNTCPPSTSCSVTGDGICDTEPTKRWPDCTSSINPCTGLPWQGTQYNFMHYSSCRNRFSPEQRDRMRYTIRTYFPALASSLAMLPPLQPIAPAGCIPTGIQRPNNGSDSGPQWVELNTLGHATDGYTNSGNSFYADYSCAYRTELHAAQAYYLRVGTGVNQNVMAWIDFNNDGSFGGSAEEILFDGSAAAQARRLHESYFSVPAAAVRNTPLRMRVLSDNHTTFSADPCAQPGFGQIEDYAVTILDPALGAAVAATGLQLTLAPNPASGQLHVGFPAVTSGVLRIFNPLGQLQLERPLRQASGLDLSVTALPAGAYLLVIAGQDGSRSSTRFVKQ